MKNGESVLARDGRARWTPSVMGGFTLVELLVAVSIVAIALMLSAPSFSEIIANQKARRAAMEFYTSLVLARNEAIKRNTTVTLTPEDDGWAAGWNASAVNSEGDTVVFDNHSALDGLTITGADSIQFGRSGRVIGNTAPSFTISAPDSSYVDERCIDLDLSGRPRIERKPEC